MPLSTQQTADIQKQYDPMRKRLEQQQAAALQQQNDALARREAQAGGLSGAFDKQRQVASDAMARRLEEGNEGIDAQQQAALNQERQVQEQRDWQTGERLATQGYQTGEREAGQKFTADQSAMARELQKYGIDQQTAIAAAGLTGTYNGAPTLAQKTYDSAQTQQGIENKINTGTTIASLMSNLKTNGYSPDQISQILDELGLAHLPGIDISGIPGVTEAAAPPPPPANPTIFNSDGGGGGSHGGANTVSNVVTQTLSKPRIRLPHKIG
jgi:hypothetical protein